MIQILYMNTNINGHSQEVKCHIFLTSGARPTSSDSGMCKKVEDRKVDLADSQLFLRFHMTGQTHYLFMFKDSLLKTYQHIYPAHTYM